MATLPSHESDDDDAALIAAQRDFLTSESKPAAKVIRATSPRTTRSPPTSDSPERQRVDDSLEWTHGPGWYQQMKGVRFRLDDLEDDDEEEQQPGATGRKGSRRKEKPNVDHDVQSSAASVMGDIVERKTTTAVPVFASRRSQGSTGGFPAPRKFRLPKQSKPQHAPPRVPTPPDETSTGEMLEGEELMEEIDRENRKRMAEMSEEEILELQRSLQASLSPEFQEMLLKKDKTRSPSTQIQDSTSIKSTSSVAQTNPNSSATISPLLPKQISTATEPTSKPKPISKPSSVNDTFADDKSFDEHLRTFFPASTISVPPPEWTLPVHPAEETFYSTPDNSRPDPSTMRFDFQGKYIPPTTSRTLPTHLGLHHHSLDPGAAGYTLAELAILARSVQPSQKCIALKIIGFVLTDVAAGKFEWDVQEGLWDEIEREKVIEILLEVAKGGKEMGGNRSVQRYAEDAVTRWVNAGGPKQWEQRLQKKGFERIPDTEQEP